MLNPILASAATRRMRSAKTIGILGAYAAVLLVVLAVCLNGFFQPEIRLPQLNDGIVAYQLVIVLQFALAVLVGLAGVVAVPLVLAGCGAAALVSAAKHMKRAQGSVLYREGPFAAALIWCVGMAGLVIVGGFYLLV